MKNKLSIYLIACCASLFAGCVKDDTDTPAPLPVGEGVELKFMIDAPAEITTYSAATANECNISSLYLLVFDGTTGRYKVGERIASSAVTDNRTTSPKIKILLPFETGDKVVVLVNTGQTFTDIPLTVGNSTVADIDTAFPSGNVFDSDSRKWNPSENSQPMCGEVIALSASELPVCKLYRAFAKIRVNMAKLADLEDATGEIATANVWWQMYQMPTKGNIYSPDGSLSVPGMNRLMFVSETNTFRQVPFDPDALPGLSPVYILEYNASTRAMGGLVSSSEFHKDRMCVIMRVDLKKSERAEDMRFYRIDLVEKTGQGEPKKWIDILRSHSYRVLITKVRSMGYPTVDEALANPPANIEYTVTVEDSGWGTVVSNGQYGLKIDCDTCRITTSTATVENLLRFTLQMPDAGQGQGSELDGSIATRTVRFVDLNKDPIQPGYGLELFTSNGSPLSSYLLDFSGLTIPDGGYQLKYRGNPNGLISSGVASYVQFRFGSIYYDLPIHFLHLKVEKSADFDYTGGTGTLRLMSYVVKEGDLFAAPWKAEFSTDDGKSWSATPPSWLSMSTRGAGTSTFHEVTQIPVTVAAQQGITSNPHNDALQAATPVSGTYDLSTKGGTASMNTANCYVINAPGRYSLPLVYGNAIKNGAPNSSAYTSTASGTGVLKTFVNHRNAAITNPYIYNNASCTPASATLVWQDEPNLVTNVALAADKKSLTFEVGAATIKQGNAIVAVRDASNNIMWSWHIWVTDYVPGLSPDRVDPMKDKFVSNYLGVRYKMMPVNVGWCAAETTTYDARSVKVRFTQTGTGASQIITLNQAGHKFEELGNSPYFQYGRKDPMLPAIRDASGSAIDKSCYSDSYAFDKSGTGKVTIGVSIRNPHIFYNYGGATPFNWCSATYHNLWSVDNTLTTANDNAVVKTVYDPSPAGYHLPSPITFTGFTYNGSVSGNYFGTQFNSPYTSIADFDANVGWVFYCNKMVGVGSYDTAGGTIFFPALGHRSPASGKILYHGNNGSYWAVTSNSTDYAYGLYINSSNVYPLHDNLYRPYGFPVRPVQE